MKVYQLKAKGYWKNFPGSIAKVYSSNVFRKEPTENQKSDFLKSCCCCVGDGELFNIDTETVEIIVLELELIE